MHKLCVSCIAALFIATPAAAAGMKSAALIEDCRVAVALIDTGAARTAAPDQGLALATCTYFLKGFIEGYSSGMHAGLVRGGVSKADARWRSRTNCLTPKTTILELGRKLIVAWDVMTERQRGPFEDALILVYHAIRCGRPR